jgi:hypothetical protein
VAEIKTEQIRLFDFMVMRAPEEVTGSRLRRRYIRDWGMETPAEMAAAEVSVSGLVAASELARIIAGNISVWQGEVDFVLGLQDAKNYQLTIDVELSIDGSAHLAEASPRHRQDAERRRINAINQELQLAYDADNATYRNRIGELDMARVAVHGPQTPVAANQQVVRNPE